MFILVSSLYFVKKHNKILSITPLEYELNKNNNLSLNGFLHRIYTALSHRWGVVITGLTEHLRSRKMELYALLDYIGLYCVNVLKLH